MRKLARFFIFSILIIFMILPSTVATARAGGGGSSGGGSGGGSGSGGGGFGGGTRSGSYVKNKKLSVVEDVLFYGVAITGFAGGTIIFTIRLYKKNKESKKLIKELEKIDSSWNYKELKSRAKETFYKVQNAWAERNQDLAKEYMSEQLYEMHKGKTEWMIVRHEKNILKRIKLIDAKPVGVEDYKDNNEDVVWFYIKGVMVDYIVDDRTMKMISGSKSREKFIEYWKFTRKGYNWVLDEIRQDEDIQGINFFDNISEYSKK